MQRIEDRLQTVRNGLAEERLQRERQQLEMSTRDKVLIALIGPLTALAAKAIEIGFHMLSR